jgi:hypothetical protein
MVLSSKNTGLKPVGVGASIGYGFHYSGVVNTTYQTFLTPVFDIGYWLVTFGAGDAPARIP